MVPTGFWRGRLVLTEGDWAGVWAGDDAGVRCGLGIMVPVVRVGGAGAEYCGTRVWIR